MRELQRYAVMKDSCVRYGKLVALLVNMTVTICFRMVEILRSFVTGRDSIHQLVYCCREDQVTGEHIELAQGNSGVGP